MCSETTRPDIGTQAYRNGDAGRSDCTPGPRRTRHGARTRRGCPSADTFGGFDATLLPSSAREPTLSRRPVWQRALRLLATVFLATAVAALAWGGYTWATWPDVARLASEPADTTAFMRRYVERRAANPELPRLRYRWVPYGAISVHVKRAVVSAEDMEFFHHEGFSASELEAALREALRRERIRGASTITQQLAKNLWLSPSRNPLRKVREALLTRSLERHLTKSRILEQYLNVVELGPGLYGVEAAARHYFGRSAVALDEREAAMLAASLPRPSTWHPGVQSVAYAQYVDEVLGRMARAEFLWSFVQ